MAKVLFVDDESSVRDVFVKLLQFQGHDAHPAHDAEVALEALREGGFDVVITDNVLPGMNGLELAARVREEGIPTNVVLLTGRLSREIMDEAIALGVSECISKPVTGEQVGEVVQRVMARRG